MQPKAQTLRQPTQRRVENFQWFSLGSVLFTALLGMTRLATLHPLRTLSWMCMALLTGASLFLFISALRKRNEMSKQASMICSLVTMLFAILSYHYGLGR
jgi:hypothetical protein